MSFKHSFVLFAVLGLLVATDDVLADGYQFLPGGKYRPSNETLGRVDTAQFGGSCYLIGTQTPINCHFDFKVLGLADVYNSAPYNAPIGWSSILTAGGHTSDHTDLADHPLFYRESPYVTFSNGVTTASITDVNNPVISIDTGGREGSFTYNVPEVAGLIAVEIDATFSDPYFCAGFCYNFSSSRALYTMDVGYYDLTFEDTDFLKLQPAGNDYVIKLVNPSIGHDDPTAGATKEEQTLGDYMSSDAIYQFLYLAQLYHGDSGSRLSVNDASVPVGGLYDYEDNDGYPWDTPHNGHRDGIAIDINTKDENGNKLDCHTDKVLKREANELLHQQSHPGWTAYVCEEGTSHIHINFFDPTL